MYYNEIEKKTILVSTNDRLNSTKVIENSIDEIQATEYGLKTKLQSDAHAFQPHPRP